MNQQDTTHGRRAFLRAVGASAAVALSPRGTLAAPTASDATATDAQPETRFRETEHVRRFYSVNRYPEQGETPC
jgi:hypothetical protein